MDFQAMCAVVDSYPDTRLIEANGDAFAIYDPDHDFEQRPRQGWATVVNSDVNDTASDLERPGVYRLNIGLPRQRFRELMTTDVEHDPTAIDVLFPHPVYSVYNWVSVLNPDRTWPTVRALLDEAHAFAVRKHNNTAARRSQNQ